MTKVPDLVDQIALSYKDCLWETNKDKCGYCFIRLLEFLFKLFHLILSAGLNSSALKLGNVTLGVEGKSGQEDPNHILWSCKPDHEQSQIPINSPQTVSQKQNSLVSTRKRSCSCV